jgi:hypothetical protein
MTSAKPSGPGEAARRHREHQAGHDKVRADQKAERARREREFMAAQLDRPALAVFNLSASEAASALRAESAYQRLPRGRKQAAQGVALAYSMAKAITEHPEAETLVVELAAASGLKSRKDTDAAMVAVRSVIDYGVAQEELNANRQYANVDANAVRHLLGQGLVPLEAYDLLVQRSTGPSVLSAQYRDSLRPARKPRTIARPRSPTHPEARGSAWEPLSKSFQEAFKGAGFSPEHRIFLSAVKRDEDGLRVVAIVPVNDPNVTDANLETELKGLGLSLRNGPRRPRYP